MTAATLTDVRPIAACAEVDPELFFPVGPYTHAGREQIVFPVEPATDDGSDHA